MGIQARRVNPAAYRRASGLPVMAVMPRSHARGSGGNPAIRPHIGPQSGHCGGTAKGPGARYWCGVPALLMIGLLASGGRSRRFESFRAYSPRPPRRAKPIGPAGLSSGSVAGSVSALAAETAETLALDERPHPGRPFMFAPWLVSSEHGTRPNIRAAARGSARGTPRCAASAYAGDVPPFGC